MTAKKLLLSILLLLCPCLWAQEIPIALGEVTISDRQLIKHSSSRSMLSLRDSLLEHSTSLTAALNFNTTIYFKESGAGMVSSPSFRGTTAQQTAVIWNGININSQFNGQTDFNAIPVAGYSNITIRSGGGSAIYGSSAIGGTIHLNDKLDFVPGFGNELMVHYGSFNTLSAQYRLKAATSRYSITANFMRNSSDNDFEFVDGSGTNLNGQYFNNTLSTAAGYKINSRNTLRLFSTVYEANRHFSLLTPTDNKSRYEDFTIRNLLEWIGNYGDFSSALKAAFIVEDYRYFEALNAEIHDGGTAETVVAKYDASYELGSKATLNAIAEYTSTAGRGTDIDSRKRDVAALAILAKHRLTSKFLYEISARKEITDNYESPFLFAIGTKYGNDKYSIRANASRNFRVPTFNDLYWSDGGNPNLKPESSYQAEVGADYHFNGITFSVNAYYIKIDDMIQWLPGTTASWLPRNIQKVETYGAEALLSAARHFGDHHVLINATYGYTVSENAQTGYQLIYVPHHKANAGLQYHYNRWGAAAQALYTGAVFTRSDNNPRYNVNAYVVANLSADYDLGNKKPMKIGFRLNNAFNEDYQLMARRHAPGRHVTMYFNLNF